MITKRTQYKALMATPARWKIIAHFARFLKLATLRHAFGIWNQRLRIMRIRPGIWLTMPPNGIGYLRPMTYTQNMVVAIQETM